jgi:phenylalanyl-tRNA synthetase beta chain
MRISSQWLQEFVSVPENGELAHLFEMAGLGVENQDGDVFSLEVTSNRGDCLSAIGLAREVAAMTGKKFRVPNPSVEDTEDENGINVEIESADDCTRYAGSDSLKASHWALRPTGCKRGSSNAVCARSMLWWTSPIT